MPPSTAPTRRSRCSTPNAADAAPRRSRSSIVLYVMLLLLTSQVASGVAIEKTNSVSEVLLAIVRPPRVAVRQGHRRRADRAVHARLRGDPCRWSSSPRAGACRPGIAGTLAGGAAFFVIGVALYLTIRGRTRRTRRPAGGGGGRGGALVGDADRVLHRRTGRGRLDARRDPRLRAVRVADDHAESDRARRVVAVRDRGVADDRSRHGLPGRTAVSRGVPACDRAHRPAPQTARRAAPVPR